MKSQEEKDMLKQEKNELSIDDLEKVSGGKLDDAGRLWLKDHKKEIIERAKERGISLQLSKILPTIVSTRRVYSLEELKIRLSRLVDIDNLF